MVEAWLEAAVWLCLGAQAYHYFGYPLVLLGLARLRPRPVLRDERHSLRVSLITPTYNDGRRLAEKLENSLALDYPGPEVIAVSDGASDETPAILARYAARGVTPIVLAKRSGKPTAINLAATQASGEILVISDTNALLASDAIKKLLRNFADPSVGCVSGIYGVAAESSGVPVGASEGLYQRVECWIRDQESRIGSTVAVCGALLAIRKDLFVRLPPDTVNDDLYLALQVLRQGFRSVIDSEARCWRRAARSFADEDKRRRRIAAGRLQQLIARGMWPWRMPLVVFMLASHKLLRLLLPFFMIGAFAANLALIITPPLPVPMQITLAAQILGYGLALVGRLCEGRAPARRIWRLPAFAYYVVSGNLSVLQGIGRQLSSGQSVLWERVER